MPGKKSSLSSKILTAAIFIILEVAAMVILSSSERHAEWISRWSGGMKITLWGWSENINGYFSLEQANDSLSSENRELYARLYSAQRALEEKKIDSLSLAMRDVSSDYEFIGARIVKSSRNKENNYIILDKGEIDGIMPDDGIITRNGIVGIIDAVSDHYSYGRTIRSKGLSISVRLGHNGIVCPMLWDGKSRNSAEMINIPLHMTFEKGDTVYTSGQSLIFPGGIPIGTADEEYSKDGASSCLRVNFIQDIDALDVVMVAHLESKDEIMELEARGGQL